MRLISSPLHLLLTLVVIFIISTFAQAQDAGLVGGAKSQQKLYVRPEITRMSELGETLAPPKKQYVAKWLLKINELNLAEQFIVLLAKAKIQLFDKQYHAATATIEQAQALIEDIAPTQLDTRYVAESQLILSKSLAAENDYKGAFEAKYKYLSAYSKAFSQARQEEIRLLNEKYDTSKKEKANELLMNKSKLTQLEIEQIEREKILYQRNKVMLIIVFMVFVVMLTRQITLSRNLRALAKKDHLTGVFNRRYLFIFGQQLMGHYYKTKQTFCVILLDVDHFKKVNDIYGHDVGDEVLKEIATVAKEAIRSRDIFARLGGEEFVLLLPEATLEETKAMAEHIREKIKLHKFSHLEDTNEYVSASFGVVCVEQAAEDFDTLLHAADQAMYQAKLLGRNQVVSYSSIKSNRPIG